MSTRKNDTDGIRPSPVKGAENIAAALGFAVLALLVISRAVLPAISAGTGAGTALMIIAASATSFLIPAAVFGIIFRKRTRFNFSFSAAGTARFTVAALFLLVSTAILIKSIGCYISGDTSSLTGELLAGSGFFETVFCYTVLPAVLEELVFRGVAFSLYEKGCGGIGAIIATSLFFAAAHFSSDELVTCFLSGLILGSVVYITRSVYPAMILHLINNFAGFYLENAVFKIASESKSGVLAIFLMTAITLIMLFWFLSELEKVCRKRYLSAKAAESQDEKRDEGQTASPRLLPHDGGIAKAASRIFLSPFVWSSVVLFTVYILII